MYLSLDFDQEFEKQSFHRTDKMGFGWADYSSEELMASGLLGILVKEMQL